MATRFQGLLSGINEIFEVAEIARALQGGRLTAEQASEAVSRVGTAGQGSRNDRELVDA
jgi:hypothetical protein